MAVTSPSLTKAIPISHQLVTLRQHLAACGSYPYKRKPTAAATDFIVDSSQRFGHTLAPKLALRHGPRQSISVNRAGKQVTLRRVPNQTASITASDIDDDKPKRDGRASFVKPGEPGDGVGRCGENVSPFAFVLLKKTYT